MKVQVLAKGVQGHDDGWHALGTIESCSEVLGETLLSQGAKVLEQPAVALEIGPQHSGNGQDIVAVGHRRQDVVQDEARGGLDILLVAGRTKPPALAGKG